MLNDWAKSDDADRTYKRLLQRSQKPLAPDQLVLNLAALLSLYCLHSGGDFVNPRWSRQASTMDLGRYLRGELAMGESSIILLETLLSFLRILGAIGSECLSLLDILHSVLDVTDPSQFSRCRITEKYWELRLTSGLGHNDAQAQINKIFLIEEGKEEESISARVGKLFLGENGSTHASTRNVSSTEDAQDEGKWAYIFCVNTLWGDWGWFSRGE